MANEIWIDTKCCKCEKPVRIGVQSLESAEMVRAGPYICCACYSKGADRGEHRRSYRRDPGSRSGRAHGLRGHQKGSRATGGGPQASQGEGRMNHERQLCTPENPMPKGATGRWAHTTVEHLRDSFDGSWAYYRCTDCGAEWGEELPE